MTPVLSLQSLGRSVSPAVRQRGLDYFRQHKVKIELANDHQCMAFVKGTGGRYEVICSIQANSPKTINADCTCEYVEQEFAPCKHIWATILAAQQQGFLNGRNGVPPERIIFDPEEVDDNFDDDEDLRASKASFAAKPGVPGRSIAAAKITEPNWKQQLRRLPESGKVDYYRANSDWSPSKRLIYVIDPTASGSGGLPLTLMTSELKKNGEWGKPRNGGPARDQIAKIPDAGEREILASLHGASRLHSYNFGYPGSNDWNFQLTTEQCEFLLPRIVRTGRCYWKNRNSDTNDQDTLLQWDEGGPWKFVVDVSHVNSIQCLVRGLLIRGEEQRMIKSANFISATGIVVFNECIGHVDLSNAQSWVKFFFDCPSLSIPIREFDRFLETALSKGEEPPLKMPETFSFKEEAVPVQPVLQVRPSSRYRMASKDLEGELKFRYGAKLLGYTPKPKSIFDAKARTVLRRDAAAEEQAYHRLANFRGNDYESQRTGVFYLNSKSLPDLVRSLIDEGWHVEAEGKLYRSAGKFEIDVSSGIDWFEVHGKVDFDGTEVPLPKILEAIRNRESMIELGNGSIGLIPEEWLKKYALLASMGKKDENHMRFEANQVGLLDALLAAQPEATFDDTYRKARKQFQSFDGIAPVEPPEAFQGDLRPYQRDGLGWLKFLRQFGFGGCLADDMGLGKTVQVLAMLADRAVDRPKNAPKTSLIVVPKSLVFNWKKEAERFVPHLKVLDHTGSERSKDPELILKHDLVITTYGTLRNDMAYLKDIPFDYCILDESQAIKNSKTESSKAVRLLQGKNRLAMSGTPIENHLGELWSLFDFLNPGMLGHASAFRLLSTGAGDPEADHRKILSKALKPFLLRRTKEQVAKDLPQKTEQTVYCDLDDTQRKHYDQLREYYRQSLLGRIDADGMAKSKILILEALLRLRQAACHPGLIDKSKAGESSAKLDALLPQLQEVFEEGHKALVFSQFTSLLDILKGRLKADGIPFEYLDGKTRDRQAKVDHFQNDPDCKLFLISLKAGGVGLNLTAAEYVFLLDPWWNPAVEAQAIDRAHRIGQTKPVFAYRLIARNTVEEKVLELQNRKKDLADAILNADDSLLRTLKREDLELLLS